MAKQEQNAPKLEPLPDRLLVRGAPVVVTGTGDRLSLSGELTAEQREQLGDAKTRSLMAAGHLLTEEQMTEDDRRAQEARQRADDMRASGIINPNFGTPSMTPEAMEAAGASPEMVALAGGARQDESELGDTAQRPGAGDGTAGSSGPAKGEATPVTELGLESRAVSALQAAKLNTVGDVLKEGDANRGLTHLDGIGEATEKDIRQAIDRVMRSR